jgi:quercetin dioxygenase-like cupin family protein
MSNVDGSVRLLPGEGKTVGLPGHEITFVRKNPDGAYSLIEWVAAPGAPDTPLHLHRKTDEAFYVLEGTFGFQVDKQAFDGAAGTFFFVRRGLEHAF